MLRISRSRDRADRGQNSAFIIPGPNDKGKFSCCSCGCRQIGVVLFVKEGRYIIRQYCTRCGSFDDKVGQVEQVGEEFANGHRD